MASWRSIMNNGNARKFHQAAEDLLRVGAAKMATDADRLAWHFARVYLMSSPIKPGATRVRERDVSDRGQ